VSETPPEIKGTPKQGQTLEEVHGKWTNNPTGFTYRWLRCEATCSAIEGATNQTYVLQPADVGHTIKVEETASNAGGPGTPATSTATVPVQPLPPVNEAPPEIKGTPAQGKTLEEVHGKWTNNPNPSGYTYHWLRCEGATCSQIEGATNQTYVPVAGDVGHALKVEETASNAGGTSQPATSAATAPVEPPPPPAPVNETPPEIKGTPKQGQTLEEVHGKWTNNPTGFTYRWLQCDGLGEACLPIKGASSQTYVLQSADAGHTIRVEETASNAGGPSQPATSAATALVEPLPPVNEALPEIKGKAQQGQTLEELHGKWSNSPTGFTYRWLQCDTLGEGCFPITGASSQTYVLQPADAGHTIRVEETASNTGGPGTPARSTPTALVAGTFGTTSVGASNDSFGADKKRANRYALTTAGSVSKLRIYLAPTTTAGQQVLKGLIYADSSTAPSALLASTEQLTFKNTNSAGWYDLNFSSPVKLAAGNYWIGAITGATSSVAGFRYTSVANSRAKNNDTYTSGPTNPFGAVTTDAEQTSLYATYLPG
jgi:predicted RNase H-like HicB family nuclease